MWLQRERKKLCYLKWFEAWGGHLELNAILYQSLSKIRSNSKLPSIIVTNISRSPPHTTSWFTEVRHPHLKTNRQGLLSHVHILMVSKSNLKLQVFGLFSRFVRTLTIKISSSEEPASSTSIHRVRNGDKLVILFHPSPKNITKKVSIAQLRTRRRALKISKWRRIRRTICACADEIHLGRSGSGLQRHRRNVFGTNCQCYIWYWILTPLLFKDHLWIFGFKDHSKNNEITFFKSFALAASANKE